LEVLERRFRKRGLAQGFLRGFKFLHLPGIGKMIGNPVDEKLNGKIIENI
jgi:hypothetical protein